ncbi:unnamed protein product [Didymodactylos carnosus]|uniref:FAD-dependent urate hydroxylase HpyO/Asp monooxygenase CreE-like FAD/NAD(P)-binding domain-containing protein n=1 Tax=Didymodactylos carnosus TaxID=1234261 RepID=A0A8S2IBD9_9BILA|nr:unnamed protein product [Didymodactylos carnosus]
MPSIDQNKRFDRFLSQPYDADHLRKKFGRSNSSNDDPVRQQTSSGKLAIIGVGSRGLSILERLTAIYDRRVHNYDLDVYLIDPGRHPGQGVHSSHQSQHLLINTVACQVTMFGDASVKNCGPLRTGPSLFEWAQEQGYRRMPDGQYAVMHDMGEEIQPNDYLPRSMLGEYLTWVHEHLVQNLPSGNRVHYYNKTVIDILRLNDGRLRLILDGGQSFDVDCAVLTTGHGQNQLDKVEVQYGKFVEEGRSCNPHLRYLRSYPLTQLQTIAKEATVAIQGLGLSCHDLLSELTCGRGGQFLRSKADKQLSYVRSGHEPAKIYLYSRNCLPFSARGKNGKGVGGQYQASFFTRSAIDQLRQNTAQLDFDTQLFPILVHEMCYAYECTLNNEWSESPDTFQPSENTREIIHRLLYPLHNITFNSYESFLKWVVEFVERDLDEAQRGNVKSPMKAATDVLRDVRDTIRYAVDFRGLAPNSHRRFIQDICPIMNRIAVGPPKERNEELLALLRCGIVEFASGPNPQVQCDATRASFVISTSDRKVCADVLIKGMIDSFYPERDDSRLIRHMLKRGLIRPFSNGDYHPGGIDVNKNQNPVDAKGISILKQKAMNIEDCVVGLNDHINQLITVNIHKGKFEDLEMGVVELNSNLHEIIDEQNELRYFRSLWRRKTRNSADNSQRSRSELNFYPIKISHSELEVHCKFALAHLIFHEKDLSSGSITFDDTW